MSTRLVLESDSTRFLPRGGEVHEDSLPNQKKYRLKLPSKIDPLSFQNRVDQRNEKWSMKNALCFDISFKINAVFSFESSEILDNLQANNIPILFQFKFNWNRESSIESIADKHVALRRIIKTHNVLTIPYQIKLFKAIDTHIAVSTPLANGSRIVR